MSMSAQSILTGSAEGPIIASTEPLSFWGGIDPATGKVIDVHHPLHGRSITGAVVMMPSTRGSCTGSGVLLDLVLSGRGPAALVFSEAEDVVTLGALIAAEMFECELPVLRVSPEVFMRMTHAKSARITPTEIRTTGSQTGDLTLPLTPPAISVLDLTEKDRAILAGESGIAAQQAMRIICATAVRQGASQLTDVTQGHIDGCIYASPANLTFAEKMADMGAQVCIPTTMNAISVDHDNWREQGVPPGFGGPAQRLADAYVRMGCQSTFTCSPYLLESAPELGETIAWSESNAVIYANTVLGARTAKHADFLDLCIALTARAPLSGVYLEEQRKPQRILQIDLPDAIDDAFWPLIGWLAGKASPDQIPLLRGLVSARPERDDLKALCAAFGTTSAAPMLHVEGVTPEAPEANDLPGEMMTLRITHEDMIRGWKTLNEGPEEVELVAVGSPHSSLEECQRIVQYLGGRKVAVSTIVTTGRKVMQDARDDGTLAALRNSGVQVISDLCWCTISEPVFPAQTSALMTNSGKYAHYGPGLSGRKVRFGSLAGCVQAALNGRVGHQLPDWL